VIFVNLVWNCKRKRKLTSVS